MAKTTRTPPHKRSGSEPLGPTTPLRKKARLRLPRAEKHATTMEEDMDHDPRVRKLFDDLAAFRREYGGEDYAGGAAALSEHTTTTQGGSMSGMDAHEDAISERAARNERWGRPADRDTALAELVNEGQIPLWEPRPPVQPRERQGGAVEVRDDF